MNRSAQAGFELLLAISFVVVITAIMSSEMLSNNVNNFLLSRSDSARINCERLSNTISGLIKLNGLESRFYNNYNTTIYADSSIIVVYYQDGQIICRLTTKRVIDSLGYSSFSMQNGAYLLKNINGTVRVSVI